MLGSSDFRDVLDRWVHGFTVLEEIIMALNLMACGHLGSRVLVHSGFKACGNVEGCRVLDLFSHTWFAWMLYREFRRVGWGSSVYGWAGA